MSIIALTFNTDGLPDLDPVFDQACVELDADIIIRDLRPQAGDDDTDDSEANTPGRDIIVCARDKGLRGVFVHTRENGAHLGIATPASSADYSLFAYLCKSLQAITGREPEFAKDIPRDKAYTEPLGDIELFSEGWTMQCLMADHAACIARTFKGDFPAVFECYNYPVAIGPRVLASFKLYPVRKPSLQTARAYHRMTDYLASVQWKFEDVVRTSQGRCMVRRFDDPDEREAMENNEFTEEDARRIMDEINSGANGSAMVFSMSAIPVNAPDEVVAHPQFLTYGDYVSFFDMESQEQLALVPFSRLDGLIEDVPGSFIDESQYIAEEPLDDSQIAGMLSLADRYSPPSPFVRPTYPGMGAPDGQRTFIFFWTPGVNGPTIAEFRRMIPKMQLATMQQPITQHTEARMGDRFFLVCNSPRMPKGIVMSGILSSNPYLAEGGDGETRRVDLRPNFMMDTRHPSLLTSDLLTDAFPDFDWNGGPTGRRLPDEDAAALEELWAPQLDYAVHSFVDSGGEDKSLNAIYPRECRF